MHGSGKLSETLRVGEHRLDKPESYRISERVLTRRKENAMYKGRTLTDLATELKRQAQAKRDFRAPSQLIEMSARQPKTLDRIEDSQAPVSLQLRIADRVNPKLFEGTMTELFHDQLGKFTGIPGAYYDKMRQEQPALLAANVNCWLRHDREVRLVRTLDGHARAFLSNKYRTIDNWDMAEAALPILIGESKKLGGLDVVSCDVTERRLYLKAISKRLTFEVKKGDAVQAGVNISNSEVGKGSVRVEPFLYRLICENGAVIEDSAVRRFHVGRAGAELETAEEVFTDATREADDKAFFMKLQDVIRAAFDDANFDKLKTITIDATTRKIKTPAADVVEEVANRFSLTEKHKGSFLNNLIEGGDLTQWGLANALTQVANTAEDYETATELERAGGALMVMSAGEWKELAAA